MSLPRLLNTGYIGPDTEVWILIRLCDAKIGARRIDSSNRIAEIVVLRQRRADQFLELFVLENFEPFKLGNGLRRELSQQKRREMHPALSRQAAGNPDRPCSRSAAGSVQLRRAPRFFIVRFVESIRCLILIAPSLPVSAALLPPHAPAGGARDALSRKTKPE